MSPDFNWLGEELSLLPHGLGSKLVWLWVALVVEFRRPSIAPECLATPIESGSAESS